MRTFLLALLGSSVVFSCKLSTSSNNESATKELVVNTGDGNYFRYWIEGKDADAKVFRAVCPDKKNLTVGGCKKDPQSQSMPKKTFEETLSNFIYTENIPFLKSAIQSMTTQLANPKMPASVRPDIEAGKKFYEDALAYSNDLAKNSNAVTDLIGQADLKVHDLSSNDPKLASYRVPEFFLGKVFQTIGSTGPIAKPNDVRMIDYTHTGGTLFVKFAESFSSPLGDNASPAKPYRCISAGKISDYENLNDQPIFKDQAACCVMAPDTKWKLDPQMNGFVADPSSICSHCVTIRFQVPGSNPSLTCNFGVERDMATIELFQKVLGSKAASTGSSR